MINELRRALRRLSATPGFTAVAFLILTLGLGANAALFTLARSLFSIPPPAIGEPENLIGIWQTKNEQPSDYFTYADYAFIKEHSSLLTNNLTCDDLSATWVVSAGSRPVPVGGGYVCGDYFEVLRVQPLHGRAFADEDRSGAAVTVLSHSFWMSFFGGDPSALGRSLLVNDRPFEIVGIAPEGFHGPSPSDPEVDLWVAIGHRPVLEGNRIPYFDRIPGLEIEWLRLVGRRPADTALKIVQDDLTAVAARLDKEVGKDVERWGLLATRDYHLSPEAARKARRLLGLLSVIAALVLAVASANLALLFLARGLERRMSLALRAALGARRIHLIRELLLEVILVAAAGGLGGFFAALQIAWALDSVLPLPRGAKPALDFSVLATSLGLAGLSTLICGLLPALAVARVDPASLIKAGPMPARRGWLGDGIVVVQVAVSLVLLTAASLFVRTLQEALSVDLGFESRSILLAHVALPGKDLKDPVEQRDFLLKAFAHLRTIPGVGSVTAADGVPFLGKLIQKIDLGADGGTSDETGCNLVTPGYFRALGMPLLAGRDFDFQDRETTPGVLVVSKTAAQKWWPGESALGRTVKVGSYRSTVIGVVADSIHYELGEKAIPQVYGSLLQRRELNAYIVFTVSGQPAAFVDRVRESLTDLSPKLAATRIRPLQDFLDRQLAPYRTSAILVGALSSLAVLLAAAGLYGALASQVVRRSRELGLRFALGARPWQVAGSILRRGLARTLAGAIPGLAIALAASSALESYLFVVKPRDPLSFLLAPLILLVVTMLVSLLPALRAARTDPIKALRLD